MSNILLISVLGILGGLGNSLLLQDGYYLPRMVMKEQDLRVFQPGFLGNILLGIIASLITYFLGASKIDAGGQFGIALISGVGGGNIITSILQRFETVTLNAKIKVLEDALKKAINP